MARRTEEVVVTADVSGFVRGMATAGAVASTLAKRLDQADGRMANIVQTGLALAPALVPIGAVAIPAVAGLANELGIAAIAAGTAVLAFQGIGTAVKALDTYKTAPTAANFAKLQQAFDHLGPAAGEFALYLDKVMPKLRSVQKMAAQGLLPGVQASIETLMPLLPQAQEVVFAFSSSLGQLVEQGAEALKNQDWQDFFGFLEADAATTLPKLGEITANVAQGFRDLMIAFNPLSQSFSSGLAGMTASFATWAHGLSGTQGFQDFLGYVETSGPQVLDTLGSLADALIQITEAAAPIGLVALKGISLVADTLGALADSHVGSGLIAVAAGVGVLGRSLSLLDTIGARAASGGKASGFIQRNYISPFKEMPGVIAGAKAATVEFAAAEKEAALAHARYIGSLRASSTILQLQGKTSAGAAQSADELVAANKKVQESAGRVAEAEKTKGAAVRDGFKSFGRGAVAAGGLAVATTGMADSLGLANTATLAMLGYLGGGWGAAIGGAIGFAKDFAQANDDVTDSIKATKAAMETGGNFAQQTADLLHQGDVTQQYAQQVSDAFDIHKVGSAAGSIHAFENLITHTTTTSKAEYRKQSDALLAMRDHVGTVYSDLNNGSVKMFYASDQALDQWVSNITPALAQAGIDVAKFQKAANGSALQLKGEAAIKRYFASFGSAALQSENVADALSKIGHAADANIDPIDALKSSLDALFGVQISQGQATDDWIRAMKSMREALKGAKGDIEGNSKAALDARDAVRSYGEAAIGKAEADAKADNNGKKFAGTMIATRNAVIAAGKAYGIPRAQIEKLLATMNLTPKTLETTIKASGVLSATQKVKALQRLYHLNPQKLHTIVSEAGANPTAKKIKALADKYHLTPHQILTILKAEDHASKVAKKVKAAHDAFAKEYKAMLKAKDENASAKAEAARKKAEKLARDWLAKLKADNQTGPGVAAAKAALNSVRDKTVSIHVQTYYTSKGKPGTGNTGAAGPSNPLHFTPPKDKTPYQGGPIYGPGSKTSDSIPARLSNGEFVVKAAAVDKYGVGFLSRINGMAFANGGLAYARSMPAPQVNVQTVTGPHMGTGVAVNFNAPVNGVNADDLARKTAQRINVATAMAGRP